MNTFESNTLRVNYDDVYKFFDMVHKYICREMQIDFHVAKDLCQEGFIKAFIKMDTLNCETTCPKTRDMIIFKWVKTIVKNTIIDHYRSPKNKKKIVYNPDYHDLSYELEEIDGDQFLFKDKYQKTEVMIAISMLAKAQKISFEKFVIEEKSHKEISQELGISEGTSKSNFFKAKNNIIKNLKIIKYLKDE